MTSSPQIGTNDLTVSLADLPGGVLLCVAGAAGIAGLERLDFLLTRLLARRPPVVVLDLSGLSLLSSLAMGMLVRFRRDLARWGGRVTIAGACPAIRESLEVTGLADLFEIHTPAAGALAVA
jgi:anti-anti-sigma factor